ncbi:MAG TPA: class I SAM-dependent methyltransferase [Bryobacteraceae bacterium]|nr:class I SAM-dependent methyltransferase [Bryobacteraceae bacterium]
MSSVQAPVLKTGAAESALVYPWKSSPYSSHSALLRLFPGEGRDRSVLDIGCGNGYLARALAARGFRVTGIELPGGRRPDFPASVDLMERDLDQGLPRFFEQFDYVICADILEHLRQPAHLLQELRSVLRPGAQIIASLPNSGNIYFRWQVAWGFFPQHDHGLFDRTHLHFYTWRGWQELFREAGFQIRSIEPTSVPFERAFQDGRSPVALRAAEWISYRLAWLWKTLFAYQFVVTAVPYDDPASG